MKSWGEVHQFWGEASLVHISAHSQSYGHLQLIATRKINVLYFQHCYCDNRAFLHLSNVSRSSTHRMYTLGNIIVTRNPICTSPLSFQRSSCQGLVLLLLPTMWKCYVLWTPQRSVSGHLHIFYWSCLSREMADSPKLDKYHWNLQRFNIFFEPALAGLQWPRKSPRVITSLLFWCWDWNP
jgi:hypothetical protein